MEAPFRRHSSKSYRIHLRRQVSSPLRLFFGAFEKAVTPTEPALNPIEALPIDEANPATWLTPAARFTLLFQMAGWLISFSLYGCQERSHEDSGRDARSPRRKLAFQHPERRRGIAGPSAWRVRIPLSLRPQARMRRSHHG